MKMLVIAPHLSTGGMPQYLLKYIETHIDEFSQLKVVEFSNFSSEFIVQKEKIKSLIGKENLITLGEYGDWIKSHDDYIKRRSKLINIIDAYEPDVIYMSGTPECYEYKLPPDEIMERVYKSDRKYKIIETTHNNSFDFKTKKYIPDEFMFCSDTHISKTDHLNIPKTVWEYPMDVMERPNREDVLSDLGLDPSYLHVLNVGLINSNKNQKYIFQLARKFRDKKVQFHFIGNSCFLGDCGIPPSDLTQGNCRVWGERSDVDKFMSCMDIYLFPSKRELNPLTIKEALSWGMEVIANEDHNYTDQYKDLSNFHLLGNINVEAFIDEKLGYSKREGKFLVVSSFYNNTRQHILQTFENMLKQTHKNWVLIVGDDFSDNDCKAILKEEVKRLNHPNILYYDVRFKRELHLCQNFFKAINYDYYLVLDSDDIIADNFLEIYDENFEKYPNVFSIFCDGEVFSEEGNLSRLSVVRHGGKDDIVAEFEDRNASSYYGIWGKYHSWSMYGYGRCFRRSRRHKFPIRKNCKTSADTFALFNCLNEGDHLHLPRNLYTVLNRSDSDSGSVMTQEEMSDYDANALLAIDEYSKHKSYKPFAVYDDIWLETTALSYSSVVKNSNKINIISDISDEQLASIKFLYPDKDIILNDMLGGHKVIVWNRLSEEYRHEVLMSLEKNPCDYSIYNFMDNFNVSENDIPQYFKTKSEIFFNSINQHIRGYSYFHYFRHIIVNNTANSVIRVHVEDVNFEITFDVEGEYPKIYTTLLSGKNNTVAKIYYIDLGTGLCMHHETFTYPSKGSFVWTVVFAKMKYLDGVRVDIVDVSSGKLICSKEKEYRKVHKKVVHALPDDIAWHQYAEVFLLESYKYQCFTDKGRFIEVEKGDVCVDIGANYGFFSMYAIDKGAEKVYAIEPGVKIAKLLEKNVDGKNIEVVRKAIGNRTEPRKFCVSGELSGGDRIKDIFGSVDVEDNRRNVEYVTVEGISVCDFLEEYKVDKIDYLKVDCEGAEYEIFEAFDEDYLRDNVRKIVGEYHYGHGGKVQKILSKLRKAGFVCESGNPSDNDVGFFAAWKKETIVKPSEDLTGKKVFIVFDSKSLGDSIAWMPYVEEYRKKHNCKVILSMFWTGLFEKEYPEIEFVKPGTGVSNIHKQYHIGWYEPYDVKRNPRHFKTIPLQQTAADILGLEFKEIRPKMRGGYNES